MDRLASRRDFFARWVTSHAPRWDGRLAAAFRDTPRERYLGPGPWRAFTPTGYIEIPGDDPELLYQDITIALDPIHGINNGQPSLHALCLAALALQPGEHVLHVGAGAGYYTAILARLASPSGRVDAYEIEPDLARRAAENLAEFPQVAVHPRSGAAGELPACDVIYVSAGATAPLDLWLDALRPGGRLLFPLTALSGSGAMLLITRAADGQPWAARFLIPVMFIPCLGARDETEAKALEAAFARGNLRTVHALHRHTPPDATAWCVGKSWWLAATPNA